MTDEDGRFYDPFYDFDGDGKLSLYEQLCADEYIDVPGYDRYGNFIGYDNDEDSEFWDEDSEFCDDDFDYDEDSDDYDDYDEDSDYQEYLDTITYWDDDLVRSLLRNTDGDVVAELFEEFDDDEIEKITDEIDADELSVILKFVSVIDLRITFDDYGAKGISALWSSIVDSIVPYGKRYYKKNENDIAIEIEKEEDKVRQELEDKYPVEAIIEERELSKQLAEKIILYVIFVGVIIYLFMRGFYKNPYY